MSTDGATICWPPQFWHLACPDFDTWHLWGVWYDQRTLLCLHRSHNTARSKMKAPSESLLQSHWPLPSEKPCCASHSSGKATFGTPKETKAKLSQCVRLSQMTVADCLNRPRVRTTVHTSFKANSNCASLSYLLLLCMLRWLGKQYLYSVRHCSICYTLWFTVHKMVHVHNIFSWLQCCQVAQCGVTRSWRNGSPNVTEQ